MGIVLRRLFAAWISLLLVLFAHAQLPGNVPLPTVEYNPLLLINASVQKELGLSPAVAAKVQRAFMDEAMKLLPAVAGNRAAGKPPLTDEERGQLVSQGVTRMQARLAGMLTAPQRVRLRQLTLQSIGPTAVLQPKVVAALGISPTQKVRLDADLADANSQVANDLQGNRTPQKMQTRLANMAKLQAQAKAAGERALKATLTPTQQAKWKAMLGRPFKLSGFLGAGNLVPGLGGR